MATIAKLVIQGILDPRGINRGVRQAINQIQALDNIAKKRRDLNFQFPKLKAAEEAQKILSGAQRAFDQEMAQATEGLHRKLINPKEFAKTATQSAKEFNQALLVGLDDLRTRRILSPTIHQALVSQLKKTGLDAGKAFSSTVSKHAAAHPLLGNLTTQGQRAANSLLLGLNQQFTQRMGALREQLAGRVITVQQFRLRGRDAANEFDKGVTQGLADLRARNLASGPITQALVDSFKLAGLKSANAFNLSVSKQMGENISGIGRTLTTAITIPVLAAGAAAVKLGADFQLSMNRIQAITQATAPEMEALAQQARKLGAESQFSARDAAEAQAKLAQQSLNTAEILGIMPTVLNLAASSLINMTDAADLSTKILFGFSVPVDQMAFRIDQLVKISTIARTDIRELGDAFKFVGPNAVRAGQAFETVGAALGTLAKRGLPATLGGTALRQILNRLIAPTKKAALALKELQIEAFNADGSMKDLVDIIKQFEVAQRRAGNERAFNERLNAIFESRAGTGFSALLQAGSKSLEEMRSKLEAAGGTAKRVADTQMAGAIGAFRELRSAIEELAQAVADSGLLKAIASMARSAAALILTFSRVHPELLKNVVQFAAFAAVIGPLLLLLGKLITTMAVVRAILISINGAAALGGLAASLATGGVVLLGLALLATVFLKVAASAARARIELETFRSSLIGQGVEELEAARKGLVGAIEFNQALGKQLRERLKTDPIFNLKESFKGPESQLNIVLRILDQQFKKLGEIDSALARVRKSAASAGAAARTALDIDIDSLIDDMGKLDLEAFGSDAKTALELLSDRISTLKSLVDAHGSSLREQPPLISALERAYASVTRMLSKQKDLLSAESAELLQMRVQLEEIFASQEFKFAKIPEAELRKMLGLDKPLSLQVVPILNLNLPTPKSFIDTAFESFEKAAKKATSRKLDLDLATRLGKAGPIKQASAAYEASLKTAKVAEDSLTIAIQKSLLPLDQKKEILAKIQELLDGYEKKQTKVQKGLDKWATRLEGLANAARGVLSIADAFGEVSDSVRESTEAIIDMVDSVAGLLKSIGTGDVAGGIANAVGIIGSVVKLFNVGREAEKERNRIEKDNITTMQVLKRSIDGWAVTVKTIGQAKPVIDATIASLDKVVATMQAKVNKGFSLKNISFKSVEDLDKQLRAAGSSFEALKAIAADLGINILNEKGRLSAAGLDALTKAMDLQIQKLTQFGKSLDAQREVLELRRNVFNLDTSPVAAIQDQLTLLEKFAPGLRKMLGNFDVTTEQGRLQLERAVQELFTALEKNIVDKAMFGDINIEELQGIIKILADSFDTLRESTDEAIQSMVNVPSGFKIERHRFAAMLTELEQSSRKYVNKLSAPVSVQNAVAVPPTTAEPVTAGAGTNNFTFNTEIHEVQDARKFYRQLRQLAIDGSRNKKGAGSTNVVTQAWPEV